MSDNKKYIPIHCFNRIDAEDYGVTEALILYAINYYKSFSEKRFREDFAYLKMGQFENAITHLMAHNLIKIKQNKKGDVTFILNEEE